MYSFITKIVAIILFILLILLWIFIRGPFASNECCSAACSTNGNTGNGITVVGDDNQTNSSNLLTGEINATQAISSDTNATTDTNATDANSSDTTVECKDKMSLAVSFGNASTALSEDGKKMLDQVAPCIKNGSYEIAGHTDGAGKEMMNQKLSEARAESTKDYLVSKGADAAKLTAKGYGESKPIATNHTKEGRAKNRHIEFIKQ